MSLEKISSSQAKNLFFKSQKISSSKAINPLKIIEHLGYVQIDTISVVERAHHHVFWTRNSEYRPSDLDKLVKKRKVFEHWSHAASYLPMKDYRFSLPLKKRFKEKEWLSKDKKLMSEVLRRIKKEGALRSKDFQNTKKGKSGWWSWKPAKSALEQLFLEGELEITRREGFQKVYDLPERVIPSSIDTSTPSDIEYVRFLIARTLRHHGLATVDEIAYLHKANTKKKISEELRNMLEEKELVQVKVEKSNGEYFAFKKSLQSIEKIKSEIFIFSPFDNMMIQRKKLKSIFDFDYQIECYLPASKRKYGYFCLPIFDGTKPIARVDCKADRKAKELIINSIHYEKNIKTDKRKLQRKLEEFSKFNRCKIKKGAIK